MKNIAELLCEKLQEVALAAAIRRQGIYRRDVHGSMYHCKPDSLDARDALQWLEGSASWPRNYDEAQKLAPLDAAYELLENKGQHLLFNPMALPCFAFGWPEKSLPNFSDISTTQIKLGAVTRLNDSYLLLISVLAQEVGIDLRKQDAVSSLAKLFEHSDLGVLSENKIREIVKESRETLGRKSNLISKNFLPKVSI